VNSFNLFILAIEFATSQNALVTRRTLNKSLMTVLSAILGSVAGLLTIIGKAMANSEKFFNRLREKLNAKDKLMRICDKREYLKRNMLEAELPKKVDVSTTFTDIIISRPMTCRVSNVT
jgi:hypothetical protein